MFACGADGNKPVQKCYYYTIFSGFAPDMWLK